MLLYEVMPYSFNLSKISLDGFFELVTAITSLCGVIFLQFNFFLTLFSNR